MGNLLTNRKKNAKISLHSEKEEHNESDVAVVLLVHSFCSWHLLQNSDKLA